MVLLSEDAIANRWQGCTCTQINIWPIALAISITTLKNPAT
uniref:Uncharacterized protein n=1 Tax=Arundo donax TaxID=35708 RepID=A0A0A9GE89_ARUDO